MGRTRIALARATAAQLAIDAAGFMPLRADDMQAARIGHAWAEFNIGAAAGHVGGDGDGAALAGARDDFGFLLVVLRVEHECAEFSRASACGKDIR